MKGWLLALAVSAVSPAPLPGDAVRDEAAAIAIGQKACAALKPAPDLKWKATFYHGLWSVSVQLGVAPGNPPAPYGLAVSVQASDGTTQACTFYSTVY